MSQPDATLDVTERALSWPDRARALAVTDADSYVSAADTLKAIKALRQEVDAAFDPIVRAALESHRTAVAQKRKAEAPLSEAETIIKAALSSYTVEQERLRRAEEARRREEAQREEEARVLARAAAMETEGTQFGDEALIEEAHALIEHPIAPAPIAPVPKATPAVSGVTHRTTYSAQVVNMRALVEHIAKHPNLLPLLKVDQAALNAQARSLKDALSLPGVQVLKSANVAVGVR